MGTLEQCFTFEEREMLIRYCTRFTHNWSLAEDLTQQALLEAWLKSAQLYSQEVRSSWLIGIARNVCLRWVRCQRQEQTRLVGGMGDEACEISTLVEDDFDLEQSFERYELAQLLSQQESPLSPCSIDTIENALCYNQISRYF